MSRQRTALNATQLAAALGWTGQQLADSRTMLLVPAPDVSRPERLGPRWSPPVVRELLGRRDALTADLEMGSLGAFRLAEAMTERLGVDVDSALVEELSRRGFIPLAGTYKDNPLYAVYAAVQFCDWPALEQARASGALHTSTGVARVLDVRPSAVDALIRLGWLRPSRMVNNPHPAVRRGTMPMYRHSDLTALLEYEGIDWPTVRVTERGRRSPLGRLGKRDAAATAELDRLSRGQFYHRLGHRRWNGGDTTAAIVDWRAAGNYPAAETHIAEAESGDTAPIIRCAAFAALLPLGHPGQA